MFRANINVMTFSLKNICPFLYLKVMPLIENKRVDFVSGYCYCRIIFISDHFLACTGHWSQGTTWTPGSVTRHVSQDPRCDAGNL